jgi:hypothetical protein
LIEQALYFAVGFLVASFAAVVWTPIVSRRAKRLSEARARLQAPISEKQAIAERDALRAQHAVDQVRLERRLVLAEEASIGLRSELGRQSVKIITLEADATEQSSLDFDRRRQIEALRFESHDREVALGASESALRDLAAQRDRADVAEATAIARQIDLEAEASRTRARAAILEARAESVEARLDDLTRSARAAAEKAEAVRANLAASLAAQTARAHHLDERLSEAMALNVGLSQTVSRGQASEGEMRLRLADLESRLQASERVREETLLENTRQLAAVADREAALRAALASATAFEARLSQAGADARANESAAALRAQTLITAHTAMEGSLEAARADREAMSRDNDALRARIAALTASSLSAGDDAALRESIERLGREVTRLFSAQKSAARDDLVPAGRFPFAGPDAGLLVDPSNDGRRKFGGGPPRRAARPRAPDR